MIGGKRYLPGDQALLPINVYFAGGMEGSGAYFEDLYLTEYGESQFGMRGADGTIRTGYGPAERWYTTDEMVIEAMSTEPGYGGIRWKLLGLLMVDYADDLVEFYSQMGAFIGDLCRGLLREEMLEKYLLVMDKMKFATRPLFGGRSWDRQLFPEGKVNLEEMSNILLGISVMSWVLTKIPGLAAGIASTVSSLRARAKVVGRHNEVMDAITKIESLIATVPQTQRESQFKMLDDEITPQALKALSTALVNDQRSPISKLYKAYPNWGVMPD